MSPVDDLRRAIKSETSVTLAVLFGSAARDEMRRGSDLDMGVLGPSRKDLSALQVTLERATERTVDLIALTDAPPLLRFEISRDGRLIFQRSPHLWSDFKARAMIDWWDWAPTARIFHQAAAARLRSEVAHDPA